MFAFVSCYKNCIDKSNASTEAIKFTADVHVFIIFQKHLFGDQYLKLSEEFYWN